MTWLEYEYAVEAFHVKNARHSEPIRELQAMMYNMHRGEGPALAARQLYRLYTDLSDEALAARQAAERAQKAQEDKAFFDRMLASNFQITPARAGKKG